MVAGRQTVELATDNPFECFISLRNGLHTVFIGKEADASKLPWGELKVDVVLECTGFYTSKEKASAHITAGARKVVISVHADLMARQYVPKRMKWQSLNMHMPKVMRKQILLR